MVRHCDLILFSFFNICIYFHVNVLLKWACLFISLIRMSPQLFVIKYNIRYFSAAGYLAQTYTDLNFLIPGVFTFEWLTSTMQLTVPLCQYRTSSTTFNCYLKIFTYRGISNNLPERDKFINSGFQQWELWSLYILHHSPVTFWH